MWLAGAHARGQAAARLGVKRHARRPPAAPRSTTTSTARATGRSRRRGRSSGGWCCADHGRCCRRARGSSICQACAMPTPRAPTPHESTSRIATASGSRRRSSEPWTTARPRSSQGAVQAPAPHGRPVRQRLLHLHTDRRLRANGDLPRPRGRRPADGPYGRMTELKDDLDDLDEKEKGLRPTKSATAVSRQAPGGSSAQRRR